MNIITRLKSLHPSERLSLFLWFVTLHSLVVGIGLVFAPTALLRIFGFSFDPLRFFVAQGGVFHLVMSLGYGLAAKHVLRFEGLIILAICAKIMATIFLIIYFFVFDQVLIILLSGLGDFAIGVIIYLLNKQINRHSE